MNSKMEYTKDLSIVISLYNEEESIPELVSWIETVMAREGYSYEILMVDDGSRDASWKIVRKLAANNESIRGISFRRNYGQKGNIEQRLVCHWAINQSLCLLYKLLRYNPDGQNGSCHKHQYSSETKEMHRFLAESA